MERKPTLVCSKCQVEPELLHAAFHYLDRTFHQDVLRCPKCGQVYLPEEFVKDKMVEVETKMEDDFRTLNAH